MKKKVAIGTGIFAVIIALVVSLYAGNVSQAGPKLSHEEVKSLISSQYPGTIMELELDREDKRPIYEIEILNKDTEYELEVDANTGEIVKLKERRVTPVEFAKDDDEDDQKDKKDKGNKKESTKKESSQSNEVANNSSNDSVQTKIVAQESKQNEKPKQTQKTTNEVKQSKQQSQPPKKVEKQEQKQTQQQTQKKQQKQERKHSVISRQQAINIALAQFPGKVEEVDLDDDDGRLIYEIEIKNGDREAEFEIDAITGKIIDIEIDD